MDEWHWFDCHLLVAVVSLSISDAQPRTALAFLHLKAVNQNASLEAELLDLTSIPFHKLSDLRGCHFVYFSNKLESEFFTGLRKK